MNKYCLNQNTLESPKYTVCIAVTIIRKQNALESPL